MFSPQAVRFRAKNCARQVGMMRRHSVPLRWSAGLGLAPLMQLSQKDAAMHGAWQPLATPDEHCIAALAASAGMAWATPEPLLMLSLGAEDL